MFYPPFFPASVRTFDSQPIGPGEALVREPQVTRDSVRDPVRVEIPLDLSNKPIRQASETTAPSEEIGMFLDHRHLFHLATLAGQTGVPGTLMDPTAMYRVPYRMDGSVGVVPGMPYNPAMITGLLQQRDRCMDTRTASVPVGHYLDANALAALSLQLRANAANGVTQRDNSVAAAAMAARGYYGGQASPNTLAGYSMFPEFYPTPPLMKPPPQSDPNRRPEEKGAFKSLRPKASVPTTSSQTNSLEANHYAEQLQRLREQHLEAKCGTTYYVPTSSPSIIGHPHSTTNTNAICPCCTIRGVSPHPPGLCQMVSRMAYSKENSSLAPTTYAQSKPINSRGNAQGTYTFPTRSIITSNSTGMGLPAFSTNNETHTTSGSTLARPDPLPIYVPGTSWNSGLPTISSTNKHPTYSVSKVQAPAAPSSNRRREAVQNHKESPRPARDFPSEKTHYLSNSTMSKEIGNSKLAELASHTNRIFGGQYQSTTHFSHPTSNQNEDREVIIIDDDTKIESVSPSSMRPGGHMCNGLRIPSIPSNAAHNYRNIPEQSKSPVNVSGNSYVNRVSAGTKRTQESEYPEVVQHVPAKMPRLEAAVRQNGSLSEITSEALSPTGPPPLLTSAIPTNSMMNGSSYLPVYRLAKQPTLEIQTRCQNVPKKVLPVIPTPTVPTQIPQQFASSFRLNGIPHRDASQATSPCPATTDPIPETGSPKTTGPLKCGLPSGTEPSTAAAVGEYEKHFAKPPLPSVPVTMESAGGTNCLRLTEEKQIPCLLAPIPFRNVPLVVPAVKPSHLNCKEINSNVTNGVILTGLPKCSLAETSGIDSTIESHRAFKIYCDYPKFDLLNEQKLEDRGESTQVPFSTTTKYNLLPQDHLRKAESEKVEVGTFQKLGGICDLMKNKIKINSPVVKLEASLSFDDALKVKTEQDFLETRRYKDEDIKDYVDVSLPQELAPLINPEEKFLIKKEFPDIKPKLESLELRSSPSPKLPKKQCVVEEDTTQGPIARTTDARTKKKLRRRLLERLHQERMGATSPEDELLKDEGIINDNSVEEAEICGKLKRGEDECDDEDVDESTSDDKAKTEVQPNLSWRQRRLMQLSCSHVRRRRFRSGLDMIRRYPKKKVKPKIGCDERRKEEQRHIDDSFPKIVCDSAGELVMPPEMKKLIVNKALGETILHKAARQCYPDVVLYCLATKSCEANSRDNAGYTPLHECCSRGHLEVARVLLQYGADVNASAAGGIRPLHDAVENDHVEVVRLLLSYGADPTISTYSGLSPLKLARSPIMSEFLRGFMADLTGEAEGGRPPLPWQFMGSTACLDTRHLGYDVFEGVPPDLDREGECDNDFLFEVSDSPHLPTFRLQLPSTGSKAVYNWLRLCDILKQVKLTKQEFSMKHVSIEVQTLARREFESSASFSQLLTGTKMDATIATDSDIYSLSEEVDVVKLDNNIREILGIETVLLR